MSDVFERISGQPFVRDFLRSCVEGGRVSHAYLFCGPSGSNKMQAALAFSCGILCAAASDADRGPYDSQVCRQVFKGVHPDVHLLAPEGAQGYVIDQIREVMADTPLAPIQASRKVYIIDRAELLGTAAANAFLKTLEEPPADVVLILLARTAEGVLPTIASRCQIVPFRHIPPSEAASILADKTGCSSQEARIAVETCGGSAAKAEEFLGSQERRFLRSAAVQALSALVRADDLEILEFARSIEEAAEAPLDSLRQEHERSLDEKAEFLQKSAVKALEVRQKRALSQAGFELYRQAFAAAESWLRDLQMTVSGAASLVVNTDCVDGLRASAARTDLARVCRALRRVQAAEDAISYNVRPQVIIEAMLFEIREELYA